MYFHRWGPERVVATPKLSMAHPGLVAFTYVDLAHLPDWRERLHWPIPHAQIVEIGRKVPESVLVFISSLTDDLERQVAIVAAGQFAAGFMALLEATWVCDRANLLNLEIAGGPPEMSFLKDGQCPLQVQEFRGPFSLRPVPNSTLRALARAATWTQPWKIPLTLVRPEAVALSYNALLMAVAPAHRVSYRHAPNIVLAARRASKTGGAPMADLAGRVIEALLPLAWTLRDSYRERLRQVFIGRLANLLTRVADDICALRHVSIPLCAWSGTSGAYATRAVTSEIIRRGGVVDSFDHGGATGISQLPGSTALIELCTSTRFHLATSEWANLLAATDVLKMTDSINRAILVGEKGEPTFRQAFRDGKKKDAGRPRVIYVGHPHRGLRHPPIGAVADTIYWDFQIDLVQTLQKLPIDLLCKPHPEGEFVGRRNPIEDIATTSYRRFEEHLDDADIFLFDAPTSTPFLETLCTRRPVVLIDRLYQINPAIECKIRERCQVVPSYFDERNRLRVDARALTEAILGAPRECDPTYFRYLAGGSA